MKSINALRPCGEIANPSFERRVSTPSSVRAHSHDVR
jgi:hypothetical protein